MKSQEQLKSPINGQIGLKLKKMLDNKISLYTPHARRIHLKQIDLPIVNTTKSSLGKSKHYLANSEIGHYLEAKKNSYSTIDYQKNNITLSNKEMLHEMYGTFNTIQSGKRITNSRYKNDSQKMSIKYSPIAKPHNVSLISSYKNNKREDCRSVSFTHNDCDPERNIISELKEIIQRFLQKQSEIHKTFNKKHNRLENGELSNTSKKIFANIRKQLGTFTSQE